MTNLTLHIGGLPARSAPAHGHAAAVSAPPFCLGKRQRGAADKGAGPAGGGALTRRGTRAAWTRQSPRLMRKMKRKRRLS